MLVISDLPVMASIRLVSPKVPPSTAPMAGPSRMAPTATGTVRKDMFSTPIGTWPMPIAHIISSMATNIDVSVSRFVRRVMLLMPLAFLVETRFSSMKKTSVQAPAGCLSSRPLTADNTEGKKSKVFPRARKKGGRGGPPRDVCVYFFRAMNWVIM